MPTCAHLPSLEEAWGVTGRRLCCPPAVPRGRRRARTVLLFSSSSQLPPQELARVLAVRTPAQGPAHSTRSGLHVAQARTADCPPRMHRPRTRRAARGLLRGPPAHGPDRSRQKGKRDVEARGRERGREDGRACADRGRGRTASVPGEGCWGRGGSLLENRHPCAPTLRPYDCTPEPCPGLPWGLLSCFRSTQRWGQV